MKTDYEKQTKDFLTKTGVMFWAKFLRYDKYFPDDKEGRDIYEITLERGQRKFVFTFGQSINNSVYKCVNSDGKTTHEFKRDRLKSCFDSKGRFQPLLFHRNIFPLNSEEKILEPKAPTAYDVLACLQKYDVGTFEQFCSEFGYDTDSRTAEKTYHAVKNEYVNVCALWNEAEVLELQEIQ